jgi:hypothetical protein
MTERVIAASLWVRTAKSRSEQIVATRGMTGGPRCQQLVHRSLGIDFAAAPARCNNSVDSAMNMGLSRAARGA